MPDEVQQSSRRSPDAARAPLEKAEVDACRRCELYGPATQGVAGAGAADARLMLVGEQPGNDEDLAGRPFVGPAGQLLRELLAQAGIAESRIYLTNAVKHFHFELRGRRRLHKTPLQRHVAACQYWLEREIDAVAPALILTLGATALRAVLGRGLAVASARAQTLETPRGIPILATYHPSALLRAPDARAFETLRKALLEDLQRAAARALRAH